MKLEALAITTPVKIALLSSPRSIVYSAANISELPLSNCVTEREAGTVFQVYDVEARIHVCGLNELGARRGQYDDSGLRNLGISMKGEN